MSKRTEMQVQLYMLKGMLTELPPSVRDESKWLMTELEACTGKVSKEAMMITLGIFTMEKTLEVTED